MCGKVLPGDMTSVASYVAAESSLGSYKNSGPQGDKNRRNSKLLATFTTCVCYIVITVHAETFI